MKELMEVKSLDEDSRSQYLEILENELARKGFSD